MDLLNYGAKFHVVCISYFVLKWTRLFQQKVAEIIKICDKNVVYSGRLFKVYIVIYIYVLMSNL